jgi:hypothetical protein
MREHQRGHWSESKGQHRNQKKKKRNQSIYVNEVKEFKILVCELANNLKFAKTAQAGRFSKILQVETKPGQKV